MKIRYFACSRGWLGFRAIRRRLIGEEELLYPHHWRYLFTIWFAWWRLDLVCGKPRRMA